MTEKNTKKPQDLAAAMAENAEANTPKSAHCEREERILRYWDEKGVFEKTLTKEAPKGEYIFYDGPPFATGLPHYGHILAGTIKDVIPRWKTMQGYYVPRRWGWDCHGLPVENLIEKELGLKNKKEIVDYGIGKFNEAARESVMRYADEWRKIVPRLGRFVDMNNDYRTLDTSYTESVWWSFKQLWEKGLVYEDFKSMFYCPRCETTLSNFEVAQGYKDIADLSVYVKFRIKEQGAGSKEAERTENGARSKGDGGTYFLAWTTTPWTLPGNVALAVNPEFEYVKVKVAASDSAQSDNSGATLILAKSRLSALKEKKYEIVQTLKGTDLVGLSYEPLFNYYSSDPDLKNRENGWKVYAAEFVTAEDGTGIVHIASAFGSDDYDLLKKHNLPFVQHVAANGKFKPEVADFHEMPVKPIDTAEDKNAHQSADVEVIKWLAHHGYLFEKEKIVHSYPHCWRCDTPLLNYATSSWFVKVTAIKDKLVKENEKVTWVPPEIGSARFGNWLEGARDWAVSRNRFWGAPIPVWRIERSKDQGSRSKEQGARRTEPSFVVLGTVEDLTKYSRAKNTYYVMRHGIADNNAKQFLNGENDGKVHLTAEGKEGVKKAAESLKGQKFDLIITSPMARAKETAEIIKTELAMSDSQVQVEETIRECRFGTWEGESSEKWNHDYPLENRFVNVPEGAETYGDIKKRMGNFLYGLEKKYQGKNILIVTHGAPAMMMTAVAQGMNRRSSVIIERDNLIQNAEVRKVDFNPLPHNEEYVLDLHRPYIDTLELATPKGEKLVRVPDVFDCWYESGSMPYGKAHYPFAQHKAKDVVGEEHELNYESFEPSPGLLHKAHGYPADFIAEGLDQTRGWFYSMLVLGVALFGKSPYKKVIVNGLVLAEDGQKMSKRLKNYPDPIEVVNKYGADSLRLYMLSSPVVHGQDLCFSERGVDEVTKKIVNRLLNVLSFYEMYAGEKGGGSKTSAADLKAARDLNSTNLLDLWVISRLNETINEVSKGLEAGELDRAVRPFFDFIDDLSTWYLRRSRDRFKGDDADDVAQALNTTRFVLSQTAKLLAPFMPFLAEEIYSRTAGSAKKESVHLESWPEAGKVDQALLGEMKSVREIASKALEARMAAKINVRQPLANLEVKSDPFEKSSAKSELIDLIKEEVNVKNVNLAAKIENDIKLDTNLTAELKEEGALRELLRKIQDLRKEKGLKIGDRASLVATADLKDLVSKYEKEIVKLTNLSGIEFGEKFEIK
jgi:isoleucyl-tRNA synthetase